MPLGTEGSTGMPRWGTERTHRALAWLALFLAALAGFAFRAGALDRLSAREFSYSLESVFRFRYAEMRMLGDEPPALDAAAQWPEGFAVERMLLSLPDRVAALTHRLGWEDPFLAARATIIAFSALGVVAFALLALAVLRRPGSAAAATLVYAGCFGAWARTMGNYLREDFALPGLLLATAATAHLLFGGENRRLRLVAAAAGVAGALWAGSTWHMSQFYLALLGALIVATGLTRRLDRAALAGGALWLGLVLAAALNAPLRAKGALWNVSSALTLAPVVAWALARGLRRAGWERRLLAIVALVLAGAALLAGRSAAYGHVYALVLAKITHLGRHPGPEALSPDARLFWVGPFESPGGLTLFIEYGLLLLPAGVGLALVLRATARERSTRWAFVALSALGFGVLYLLMQRMTVFLAPWLAVLCVAAVALPRRRSRRVAAGALTALALGANVYGGLSHYDLSGWYHRTVERTLAPPAQPLWHYGSERAELLRWLLVAPPGGVLTDFSMSALLLYATGRPIALHPMFEVPLMRTKSLEYADAAVEDEAALLELCRRWDVRHVVHFAPQVLSRGTGSFYALTGRELTPESAAFRMQFEPQSLQGLRLVLETYTVRVFEVGRPYDGYVATARHPLFDPQRFPSIPETPRLAEFYAAVHGAQRLYLDGVAAQERGDFPSAAAAFDGALQLHPDFEDAALRLGMCFMALDRPDLARPAFERAAAARPGDPRPREFLSRMEGGG